MRMSPETAQWLTGLLGVVREQAILPALMWCARHDRDAYAGGVVWILRIDHWVRLLDEPANPEWYAMLRRHQEAWGLVDD